MNTVSQIVAAAVACIALLNHGAQAQSFVSNMDVVPGVGWTADNNSSPLGPQNWVQGDPAAWTAHSGAANSWAVVNYNSTTGTGTISNWLISPTTTVGPGGALTFWTRTKIAPQFPDRMQVRLSTSGASISTGTIATDLGAFTVLLLDINPTYTITGYPTGWAQYTIVLNAGHVAAPTLGRIAFRYFVENGGPTGLNSDFIGVDTVSYNQPVSNCLSPLPACPADVALPHNGAVDVLDLLAVINQWGMTGPPRPAADCDPAPNGDCTVSVLDLLKVINTWGACAVVNGACVLPNQTCALLTQANCSAMGGLGWAANATCDDTDGDRIPDAFELNNCSAAAAGFVGTNPNNADTDGDRIRDGDELYGTTAGLNLPALGANPLRKNLFMECDWTSDVLGAAHSHQPPAAAVTALINAFAASPVTNVCGGPGITLVVDYGQGGLFTGGNLVGADEVVLFDSEFNVYKAAHFAANRSGYFYYGLHTHRYNDPGNNSSGVAEWPGDDHIISLQEFSFDVSGVSKTMMHEFGHNLGLHHGGSEPLNYKPNYNSVMNYRYQFPGTDSNCNGFGDGGLNYSLGLNAPLNENALLETNGICSGVDIDWNGNAIIDAGPVARSINCNPGTGTPCGTPNGACLDSICGVLNDTNDWGIIVFLGISNADFVPEIIRCEAPLPQR